MSLTASILDLGDALERADKATSRFESNATVSNLNLLRAAVLGVSSAMADVELACAESDDDDEGAIVGGA
jgi:hypothetical protein